MDLSGHCADWIYLTQPPFSPSLRFLSHGWFRISSTVGLTSLSTPFLGVVQVNSIKLDKNPQSIVPKDLLNEVTVSIGVQILLLKLSNSTLSNRKESDWVWNHGYNVNVAIPGKMLQQISLDVIKIGEDSQRKVVGYGFHSNEL